MIKGMTHSGDLQQEGKQHGVGDVHHVKRATKYLNEQAQHRKPMVKRIANCEGLIRII